MSLTPSNVNNPCPICEATSGKCRQSNEDSNYWQCMTYTDSRKGEIIAGYKCIGHTKDRLWGQFKFDNSQEWSAQQRLEWQRENQRRRNEKAKEDGERRRRSLSAAERHEQYTRLLSELILHPDDRADLLRRGFTHEQIELAGFKSIESYQRLQSPFSTLLPGISATGKELLVKYGGYLCPVRNADGLIVACQIRLRALPTGEGNRYRWLSSKGQTLHLFPEGCEGELPLAVFRPQGKPEGIALAEGTGAKPFLVSQRLNLLTIGAAGGQWASSRELFRSTLEKVELEVAGKVIKIFPDAGDILNQSVMSRWQRVIALLEEWGWSVRVGWWGQANKNRPDVDELADLSTVSFITVEDFLSWAERGETDRNASVRPPQKASILNQPILSDKSQKLGNSQLSKTNQESLLLLPSTTSDILNPPLIVSSPTQSLRDGISKVLPIPESVASCWITEEEKASRKERRWFESVLKRIKKVLLKSDKRPRLGFKCFEKDNPEFEEKIRQVQRKLRSLSYDADIETNQRYLPNDLVTQLPKSGLIGIKAPKGCGKSVLLKKIIALAKKQGIPVLSITPRIALGREQAIKWEITWIDDYGVLQTRAGDTTSQIQEVAEKRAKARVQLANLDSIKHQQLSLLGEGEILAIEQQKADLRIEIERYGEEIENINSASVRTLALCWDSLWRTKDRDLKEALIIIDEAELGFQHFISGSTCKRNRPQLLQVFKTKLIECLMNGGRVILSDADLTDLPINYIREVLPIPIKPFIVTNNYIGDETRWIVDLRTGGRGDSRGNTLTDIIESIRDGKYLAITTDSQAEAQALERRILEEDFPDEFCPFLDSEGNITDEAQAKKNALIVRIDRTTTESEAGKKFIQKPNEQILHWQPRILIYTPSMGVGVSIDESTQRWDSEWEEMVPYFDAVYGLFFGVIEPSQCRQQLARVRANVPRIVWCKEANKALEGCSSFFPDDVKRQTLKYNHSALNILDIAKGIAGCDADDEEIREAMLQLLNEAWDSNSRCWKEPSIDLASAFKARENYGKWNLANLLREELQDEGHTVVSLKGTKTHEVSEIAEIKDHQKAQEATLIAEAPLMPIDEARKILSKLGTTKDEYRSAQKTLLQDELPEVDLTPEFVKKAVVDDRRRWLNQQRLFWYYTNAEALKQIDTDHWLGNLKKFTQGIPFMRDVRSHAPKVDALRKSGVFEFIDLEDCDRVYESDTTEAKKFLKQCLKHKDLLQTALNVLVTKKASPIGVANRILGKVGLELQKVTRSHKDTRWKLSADLVYDPDRTNVLKALELRWRMSLEEAQKNEAEKQAQTHTQQTTQVGGQSADYIYTNQRIPPPIDVVSQGSYKHSQSGGEPVGVGVYSEPQKSPQIQSQTALQVGGQSADYIYTNQRMSPPIDTVSQGCGGAVCEVADSRTDLQRLVDALEAVGSLEEFTEVTGGREVSMVEKAIAGSGPDQPRRKQLEAWLSALVEPAVVESSPSDPQIDEQEEKRHVSLAKMLSEALGHGWGTVKSFLSRLDKSDRWVAAMKLEEIDEARSRELLNPDFYRWLRSMP